MRLSGSGLWRVAGGSSTPWGQRSPSCRSRSAALPPRPGRRLPLFIATHFGIPVSRATHAITGYDCRRRERLVDCQPYRWGIARQIVWALAADDTYGSDHRSRALPGHRAHRSPVRRARARDDSESGSQGSCHTHNIDDEAPRTAPSSGAVLKAALPWRPGLPTGMAMYCLPSTM